MKSLIGLLAIALVSSTVAAQDKTKDGERHGDPVRAHVLLKDSTHELVGDLLEMDAERLTLLVAGMTMRLPLNQVSRVEVEKDSLKNGAIIGAAVFGAWCAIVCGQGLDRSSQVPLAVAANSAVGALLGALADSGHKGRTVLFPRSVSARSQSRWTFVFSRTVGF